MYANTETRTEAPTSRERNPSVPSVAKARGTKTRNRHRSAAAPRESLPTMRQAADYVHRKRTAESRPAARGLVEFVMATEWSDEFPRLIPVLEEGPWDGADIWSADVRLDVDNGQILYRAWSFLAYSRANAVLCVRRLAHDYAARQVTVFSLRAPLTPEQAAEVEAANDLLAAERRRLGIYGEGQAREQAIEKWLRTE